MPGEERPFRLLERRTRQILIYPVNDHAKTLESIRKIRLVRMLPPRPRNKPTDDRDPGFLFRARRRRA
jgi:hypothetical protein